MEELLSELSWNFSCKGQGNEYFRPGGLHGLRGSSSALPLEWKSHHDGKQVGVAGYPQTPFAKTGAGHVWSSDPELSGISFPPWKLLCFL